MPSQSLAQEPLGRSQIAPFAEPELDRVAMAIDGTVQVRPAPADFDVGFVGVVTLTRIGRIEANSAA
jgi:hypothetical protein